MPTLEQRYAALPADLRDLIDVHLDSYLYETLNRPSYHPMVEFLDGEDYWVGVVSSPPLNTGAYLVRMLRLENELTRAVNARRTMCALRSSTRREIKRGLKAKIHE